jgi:hypothetical protein
MARRSHFSRFHVVAAFFIGLCAGCLLLTAVHISHLNSFQQSSTQDNPSRYHHPLMKHQQPHLLSHTTVVKRETAAEAPVEKNSVTVIKPKKNIAANHDNVVHPVAGLHCEEHRGPTAESAQEMVYWRDISQDNAWKSPFLKTDGTRQYLTFEPDGGGWNNIRMRCDTGGGI